MINLDNWLNNLSIVEDAHRNTIILEGSILQLTEHHMRFVVEDICLDIDKNDIERVDYLDNQNKAFSIPSRIYIRKGCRIFDIFSSEHQGHLINSTKKPFAVSSRRRSKNLSPRSVYYDELNRSFLQKYGIQIP